MIQIFDLSIYIFVFFASMTYMYSYSFIFFHMSYFILFHIMSYLHIYLMLYQTISLDDMPQWWVLTQCCGFVLRQIKRMMGGQDREQQTSQCSQVDNLTSAVPSFLASFRFISQSWLCPALPFSKQFLALFSSFWKSWFWIAEPFIFFSLSLPTPPGCVWCCRLGTSGTDDQDSWVFRAFLCLQRFGHLIWRPNIDRWQVDDTYPDMARLHFQVAVPHGRGTGCVGFQAIWIEFLQRCMTMLLASVERLALRSVRTKKQQFLSTETWWNHVVLYGQNYAMPLAR